MTTKAPAMYQVDYQPTGAPGAPRVTVRTADETEARALQWRTSEGVIPVEWSALTASGQLAESVIEVGGTRRVLQTVEWLDPFLPGDSVAASPLCQGSCRMTLAA